MTLKHMYSTHSTVLEINHSGCFILRKLAWRSDIYISVKFVFVALPAQKGPVILTKFLKIAMLHVVLVKDK
jgi:hypothetical protein